MVGAPHGRPDRFLSDASRNIALIPEQGGLRPALAKHRRMASVEVSRTLVKSGPELWEELSGERLGDALGGAEVRPMEPERELAWRTDGATGKAVLEPSSWGTKVTLTAEVEEQVARVGLWERMRGMTPPPPRAPEIERRLEGLLDELGQAHKKPFARE